MASMQEVWPDRAARDTYEAQMLTHWAEEIAGRYPAEVWPTALREELGPRTAPAAQAAFVAGVRYTCDQLRKVAADLLDGVELPAESSS